MKVKPFLKWAGGKKQILNQIDKHLPNELKEGNVNRYIEPFVGGGAVLFYLLRKYKFNEVIINDINEDLMLCYAVIKYNVNDLIEELYYLRDEFLSLNEKEREKFYYRVREEFNRNKKSESLSDTIKKVAQFIFLNKTCYNGLYRVNKKGEFNVPYGKYKNPKIFDKENLKNVSKSLKDVKILCGDFEIVYNFVDSESFVYFDPPYKPISKTSSFTSYTKASFYDTDQIRLSNFYKKLDKKGAKLMLSNSYNLEFFKQLYNGFTIKKITAKRIINCKGNKRGNVYELLIINY